MRKLLELLTDVAEQINLTIDETEEMEHPLVKLYRTSLQEEQSALERLLSKLKSTEPPIEEIKNDLSIVYLNDEIVEPTFRAWLRAVKWMDHKDSEEAKKLENRFPGIKSRLKETGAELKEIYGAAAIRFIVPALYQ
ncbi:hypothetical protein EJP77_01290 [Paenibacillus zeisoli]|uniref:Uncharacterized protein n=1 Tax=Paenibacillus zeisoli TaxID=2496267 RepID=A0A433XNL9_9BACL|nr:hypothetical protein [Paenibacillus zeisoli]RUT35682.1 hypothetical protein EJP77_01290 [Paenibacillus zeisoli]